MQDDLDCNNPAGAIAPVTRIKWRVFRRHIHLGTGNGGGGSMDEPVRDGVNCITPLYLTRLSIDVQRMAASLHWFRYSAIV
jgi:hypothetical protein